jgi:hypothetical protein
MDKNLAKGLRRVALVARLFGQSGEAGEALRQKLPPFKLALLAVRSCRLETGGQSCPLFADRTLYLSLAS